MFIQRSAERGRDQRAGEPDGLTRQLPSPRPPLLLQEPRRQRLRPPAGRPRL